MLTSLTRKSGEIVAGEELNTKLNSRMTLSERFALYPNLSNAGELPLPVRHERGHEVEKLAELADHLERPFPQRSATGLEEE